VAPGEKGNTVAQRIVEAVAGRSMSGDRRATISAGLARFPLDGKSGDDLVRAATSALRAAQASGPGTLAEATHDGGNGTGAGVATGTPGA
jgi:GGDEF domain-containing protein